MFPVNNLFSATVSIDADGTYTLRGSMWVAADPASGDCGGDSVQFNEDLCHGAVTFDDRVLSDSQALEIERILALFPEHVVRNDFGVVDIPFTAVLEFDGRIETSECLESDNDLCGEAFEALELFVLELVFGDSAVVRCTEEARPGVLVTLTDAATGEPISGATMTLTEDGFEWILVESSSSIIPGVYSGVSERPGIYTLNVRADGYHEVVREDIVVEADICHVQTASIEVQMD